MLIIIILLLISIAGIFLADSYSNLGVVVMSVSLIMTIVLSIILITIPVSLMAEKGNIVRYHSLKETVKVARETGNVNENTAIQLAIIQMNKDLASRQYYASMYFFSIYYPKEVLTLEPIR